MPRRSREPDRSRDEAWLEKTREELDEFMLQHPPIAHLVREKPLSKKYQRGLLRPAGEGRRGARAGRLGRLGLRHPRHR